MILSKSKLKKFLSQGQFDIVRKELVRYGKIVYDKSFDVEEGYYKGANRITHFEHMGLKWEVEMLNGEVRSIGYEE